MKASSKCPRVESSTGDASRPPPFGDPFAEEFDDPTVAVDPPPSSSSVASLRSMLDTVMIVQGMNRFWWICLQSFRLYMLIWRVLDDLLHHLLLMMSLGCPLVIRHKKGEYILCMEIGAVFVLGYINFI